jgi:hypothetical protein
VKDATRPRVRPAAELKSKHAIAYADAFAVATAVEFERYFSPAIPKSSLLKVNCTSRWKGFPGVLVECGE